MPRAKRNIVKEEAVEITAVTREIPITSTLEDNYMPYSISVIKARAIPEIDGLKPSHRKLLYTMYKMGLLGETRTKSANVVGQTMKLNPHGDAAIYETLVRLTRGNEALLHPFIDSKGSFGKQYSKMAYAASRYTEVKLDSICNELFSGIDKDAVDFVDNYDATLKEPTLLPTTFPNILVSPNMGIAVGLSSNICSFNLSEICDTTIGLIEDENFDIYKTLKAPDFSTGGKLIYNPEQIRSVYETGRGSFKVRASYVVKKGDGCNCIEITNIPYTTNVEAIMDKIEALTKAGRLKEISDARDETDKGGLKLTLDLKRGTDPEKLMNRLYKLTTLEDDFNCNFNVLIAGTPKLLGVRELLLEWHAFRCECLKRELYFTLTQKKERYHLLLGLEKILVDIDKAIRIVRSTENDKDVIPNLMAGFGIDELQATFIADIKLRNLNKEYILSKVSETEKLKKEIADLEATIKSSKKIDAIIIKQLVEIKKKYGIDRKTEIIGESFAEEEVEVEEEYRMHVAVTREGYFKLIPLQSIKMSDNHKLKEGDEIVFSNDISSNEELLFFTDKAQVYKGRFKDFEVTKASALGDYVPTKLGFDDGERVIFFTHTLDFSEKVLIFYENGKSLAFPINVYQTKQNRRKLTAAFSDASPV